MSTAWSSNGSPGEEDRRSHGDERPRNPGRLVRFSETIRRLTNAGASIEATGTTVSALTPYQDSIFGKIQKHCPIFDIFILDLHHKTDLIS